MAYYWCTLFCFCFVLLFFRSGIAVGKMVGAGKCNPRQYRRSLLWYLARTAWNWELASTENRYVYQFFIFFLIVKENLWETLTSCKPINMDASCNSFNFQTPAHRKFPKVESTWISLLLICQWLTKQLVSFGHLLPLVNAGKKRPNCVFMQGEKFCLLCQFVLCLVT